MVSYFFFFLENKQKKKKINFGSQVGLRLDLVVFGL